MPDEPEVIHEQMRETRTALAEKLETLEKQVVNTVAGANEAVADTAETVKETVENVKEAVQETVDSVKESVKSAFDLAGQMDRHPWLFVGGAVAAGFVGGRLLDRAASYGHAPGHAGATLHPAAEYATGSNGPGFARSEDRRYAAEPRPSEGPGWLGMLASRFAPELNQLKSLALGTAMSVARDMLVQAAPDPLRPKVHDVIDDITTRLGAQPIEGNVLQSFSQAPQTSNGAHTYG